MKLLATALFSVLLLTSLVAPVAADGSNGSNDTIAVLIDFGNGQVVWGDVPVTENLDCFNATMAVADQAGLVVNSSWGQYGASIQWISGVGDNDSTGGWNPATGDYWAFLLWNETSQSWESASYSASAVMADSTAAIAWFYAPWGSQPLATPEHRYPWASFRHDSLGTGLESGLAPNNLTLQWQKDLLNGPIDAPIVTANGFTYVVTSGNMNATQWGVYDTDSAVYCLNSTGAVIWKAEIGTGFQIAAPLIYGGAVIVPSADGKVYAFYTSDGTAKWAPFDTGDRTYGVTSSPVAYEGMIIFAAGNGTVYALNPSDGTLEWKKNVASVIYSSSPAVRDGTVYIGSDDGKLHAIASNGTSEIWNVTLGSKVRGTPILMDDYIVDTYENYVGSTPTSGGIAAVSYDGHILWQTTLGVTPASAALTSRGFAVVTSTGMSMVGFDGNVLWNLDLGTAMAGAAPTAVNGSIFAVTNEENSRLVAVSEYGELYFQESLSPAQYALSTPAVTDGILYASADNGNVYAFDLSSIAPTLADFNSTANGLVYTFTASANDGGLFNYIWNFGDGSTAVGRSVTHTYSQAGSYVVVLTVVNPQGEQLNAQKAVNAEATSAGNIPSWAWGAVLVVIVVILAAAFIVMRKKE